VSRDGTVVDDVEVWLLGSDAARLDSALAVARETVSAFTPEAAVFTGLGVVTGGDGAGVSCAAVGVSGAGVALGDGVPSDKGEAAAGADVVSVFGAGTGGSACTSADAVLATVLGVVTGAVVDGVEVAASGTFILRGGGETSALTHSRNPFFNTATVFVSLELQNWRLRLGFASMLYTGFFR